ncbi:MAG TPA: AI-2E family transporter [Gemmataceae bacterium]|nr:AI-2E family transporter [Gemmataceae bacterium]
MSELPPPRSATEAPTLATAARWVVILVGTFFLLRELGPILKPLLLAVLLGYVILPFHLAVKRRVPGRLALVVSATLSLLVILLLTAGIQATVSTLAAEMPNLNAQALKMRDDFLQYAADRFPQTTQAAKELLSGDGDSSIVREITSRLVGIAADTVTTALVVGLYLLFLLLEAGRFPERVRRAFSEPRAERILESISRINRGVAQYLTAKVIASLILAVPVFVVLVVFGTRFALVWAVLTFLCNFIPYLGSVIGYSLPVLFALIDFGFGWEFITIAVLLLAIHLTSASVVEPAVIGRAVGLSPVVILLSLAFWGYCWGLTGMLLAVPLTVMLKIAAEHIDATRPLAKLVSDE